MSSNVGPERASQETAAYTDEHPSARRHTRELPALRSIELPGYRVTISPGLLDSAGLLIRNSARAHRYAVIADETTAGLFRDRIAFSFDPNECTLHTFPAGESAKTRDTWARLTDELLLAGHGRDSAVIALGGGVVCDVAGFVAATYMRGIPVAHIPTTLLAMVDASIGGKTGVDVPAGKNLVGAFHPPVAVLVDPLTLDTLPLRERRAAFAEMLKHGAIADAALFSELVARAADLLTGDAHDGGPFVDLLTRAITIKADVVGRDEKEGGLRKILNFGHTIGHGIETALAYGIPHGEAVGIGMRLEAMLAERIDLAAPGTADAITHALEAFGLPTAIPAECDPDAVIGAMAHDKKSRRGVVEFALPAQIGLMAGEAQGWSVPVPAAELRAVLSA